MGNLSKKRRAKKKLPGLAWLPLQRGISESADEVARPPRRVEASFLTGVKLHWCGADDCLIRAQREW